MKTLSIIVPFSNGLFYLDDCFESILAQNLIPEEYEVICLGDAPGEGIVAKIEKYEQQGLPVRYIQWFDKKGTGYARNRGLGVAEGRYVYFLDCDDYLLDGTIPRLLECANDNDADIVCGDIFPTYFKRESFDTKGYDSNKIIRSDKRVANVELSNIFSGEVTVLNMLIKHDMIKDNDILFNDEVLYYTDIPFVMKLFLSVKSCYLAKGAGLAKRLRNDPVHYPSVNQTALKNVERMINDLLVVHNETMQYVNNHPKRRNLVNIMLCDVIYEQCVKGWHISHGTSAKCQKVLKTASDSVFKKYALPKRMIIKFIASGHYHFANMLGTLLRIRKKKSGMFGNKIQWYRLIDKLIFRHLPRKKNWIVFESFFGRGYSDSPKYLYEYMLKKFGNKYKYIWVINKPKDSIKGKPVVIAYQGLRHVYYSTRAKYHIYNVRQPGWFKKEDDMVFLETWHGTPLKKLVFDMEDVHVVTQAYKEVFYKDSRLWDYVISANSFSTEVFQRAFDIDGDKIIECGYPRNDLLYSEDKDVLAGRIKKKLDIHEGKKVILYAPTWRDNAFYGPGKYKFNLAVDLKRLYTELSDEYVLLLRTHYQISDKLDLSEYDGFVYNVSDYEDVSELYLISDICVTDYSSVFFDYANLRRPILFYVYDYDLYKDELRGMYLDMETEIPGPLLKSEQELIDAIKNIDDISEEYTEIYNEFYDRFCSVDDGNASERMVKALFG